MRATAQKIHQVITEAKHLFLIPHPNPDGDALGSVAACMQYLRRIDKSHTAFCTTTTSPRLRFLPHTDYIAIHPSVWQEYQPDVVMVFDSGDLRYAGILPHLASLSKPPQIINIDHHRTNEHFGHHNLVIPTASSTTEVLYHFFQLNDIAIDPDMATCLLTGLMTDTDTFTNAATTNHSLTIAADLIRHGADAKRIQGWVFRDKSIAALKVWGVVLSRLTKHEPTDLVYTYVTQADLEAYHVSEAEAEGLANFLNSIGDGQASLLLKESTDGKIKGSFRTTRGDVDVSAWAVALGGGGHKKAAGFTVPGPMDEAITQVFSEIQKQKNNNKISKP